MGREWHWSGTRSLGRGDCKESSSSTPGCMGGMLQYLHFHHLLFTGSSGSRAPPPPASSTSSLSVLHRVGSSSQQLKGLEAPRNSLELDEGKASLSSTSAMEEEFYDVPVGIEIAPRSKGNKKMVMLLEEEKRSSQAETPRTPSVVARLMGLESSMEQSPCPTPRTPPSTELQAQQLSRERNKKLKNVSGGNHYSTRRLESPSPRQPLRILNSNVNASSPKVRMVDTGAVGCRSLPETPRVSSERYCDAVPTFSLQLNNKENTNKAMQEFSYLCEVSGDYSLPPPPSAYTDTRPGKRHQDENKRPGSHLCAHDIVEQVKETINSKRSGGGGSGHGGKDQIKPMSCRTRPAEKRLSMADPPSPQIRVLELVASKKDENGIKNPLALPPKPPRSQASEQLASSIGTRDHGEAKAVKVLLLNKCRKADNERFTERIRMQTHPPSTVNRPPRSLPTLASLFQSADLLPEKKNLPDKNKCSSLPSIHETRVKQISSPVSRSSSSSGVGCASQQSSNQKNQEFRYVKSIFERAGIAGIHSLIWYSLSLPIDPIIFHEMELEEEVESRRLVPLRHRWNRKLLFHLVQEILGDLLHGWNSKVSSPSASTTPKSCQASDGEALLRQLWAVIESFPAADCRVVGDIDDLIAGDLREANVRRLLRHPSVKEEEGEVVLEVEREILDGIVGETAASLALSSSYFSH